MTADLMPFNNGEFRLDIEPHATDGFRRPINQNRTRNEHTRYVHHIRCVAPLRGAIAAHPR